MSIINFVQLGLVLLCKNATQIKLWGDGLFYQPPGGAPNRFKLRESHITELNSQDMNYNEHWMTSDLTPWNIPIVMETRTRLMYD